ncbi:efflux RND transporter periplasmic adaptor subunit [Candidatus Woesebacteria bacterium]|nr:efflux RND transporter periplasmic adaptor subunit [Candidatus Woesebacteria bacterium]
MLKIKSPKPTSVVLIALFSIGFVVLGVNVLRFFGGTVLPDTLTTSVEFITSTITASGVVTAQNQAKLNFQTSGKLTRLPFKEGDRVKAGQTIAQLDTYALQRQLATTLNNYRSTRDTFDQTQENSENNVLTAQLAPTYFKVSNDVNDAIKRIVDQNQASLDNSVINVELANYALQLSRLTSPLDGIVTHQDVNVAGVNITPTTSFTVADPDSMVFRANIPAAYIDYVQPGNQVKLSVDGVDQKIEATVAKLYPTKVTLPSGQSVYQVDIQSDELLQLSKLDQTGQAIISTNSENVALVPAWTVVGGDSIWIIQDGVPELRQVTVGKIHGSQIEVTDGLSPDDTLVVNPKYVASLWYSLL